MESKTKISKESWIRLIKAIIKLLIAILTYLSASNINIDIDVIFNNTQTTINASSAQLQIDDNSSNQSDNFTEETR